MSQILGSQRIAEEPGWTRARDLYGITRLSRPFKGPAADLDRFLKAIETNDSDYQFKDLFFTDEQTTGQRGLCVAVQVNYTGVPGLADGKPQFSRPTITKGLVTKTVLIKAANGSGKTIELTYKAPTTTYKYSRATEPTAPKYTGQLRYFKNSFRIIKVQGYAGYPVEFISIGTTPANPTGDYFYAYVSAYAEAFEAQQVGKVWQVTERNDGVIYGYNTAAGERVKGVPKTPQEVDNG